MVPALHQDYRDYMGTEGRPSARVPCRSCSARDYSTRSRAKTADLWPCPEAMEAYEHRPKSRRAAGPYREEKASR
jgi:hypothetical protein